MTHMQLDTALGAPKTPRPGGGGEEKGESCTCHPPGSTYSRPSGGINPDCTQHNPT